MGRWSQSRRRGGGAATSTAPPPPVLAHLVSGTVPIDGQALLTFDLPVNAADWDDPSEFTDLATGGVGVILAQTSPTSITVTFDAMGMAAGDTIFEAGGNPNTLAPDSIILV